MSNTLGHRTIFSIGTQHDLVQDAKTTCHPRRDSFMFIPFHLSFYIIYYKIPIKASVKLLGQQFSTTLLSLYITLYSKTLLSHITVSKSLYTNRADLQDDRPTSPIAVTIKVRPLVSRYSH